MVSDVWPTMPSATAVSLPAPFCAKTGALAARAVLVAALLETALGAVRSLSWASPIWRSAVGAVAKSLFTCLMVCL